MAPEGTGYLGLEPYDVYWSRVRDMYSPFENGMKSGTARVFDHQIPGKRGEMYIFRSQAKQVRYMHVYFCSRQRKAKVIQVLYASVCWWVGDLSRACVSSSCRDTWCAFSLLLVCSFLFGWRESLQVYVCRERCCSGAML